MKVLKNNYEFKSKSKTQEKKIEPYPRKAICEMCESEIEYDESDIYVGEYGVMKFECPLCGESIFLWDNEKNITLTVDNIEFPIHFHHISKNNGAVDICEKYFKKYLHEAIYYFRRNKNEYFYGGHITGNLYLSIHRYEDDKVYDVTVSKDFYTIDIPFEKEDY